MIKVPLPSTSFVMWYHDTISNKVSYGHCQKIILWRVRESRSFILTHFLLVCHLLYLENMWQSDSECHISFPIKSCHFCLKMAFLTSFIDLNETERIAQFQFTPFYYFSEVFDTKTSKKHHFCVETTCGEKVHPNTHSEEQPPSCPSKLGHPTKKMQDPKHQGKGNLSVSIIRISVQVALNPHWGLKTFRRNLLSPSIWWEPGI